MLPAVGDRGPVHRRVWQCDVANLNIGKTVLFDSHIQRGVNAWILMEPFTWIYSFSLVIETTVETGEVED